jgi:hypothetical protein
MEYSDVVIKQTKIAWEFLEQARPLITYTKLVPVSEEQISQYEQKQNKIVPPGLPLLVDPTRFRPYRVSRRDAGDCLNI